MNFRTVLKRPGAFIPVAMSLAALTLVAVHIALYGVTREADEGAAAHVFQILIAAQMPVIAYFAIGNLPRAPGQTLLVLALQGAAVAAAMAPVFFLHL
jgi:hypothetical protein